MNVPSQIDLARALARREDNLNPIEGCHRRVLADFKPGETMVMHRGTPLMVENVYPAVRHGFLVVELEANQRISGHGASEFVCVD
jgi:hypothetical protein